jgi:hypothetical protein
MASSNPAIELASTIQSASINRAPSPTHDINPSTAASEKIPVSASTPSLSQYVYDTSGDEGDSREIEEVLEEEGIEVDDDEVEEVLRPLPRRADFGPLPDLRFEQSYLRSIEGCEGSLGVIGITVRDQVCTHSPSISLLFVSSLHVPWICADCKRFSSLYYKEQSGLLCSSAGDIGIERHS